MLEEGDSVPEFEALNQDGEKVSSEDISNAVIYFYPKADTPGCTREACNFRDSISQLEEIDLQVFGVSTDSVNDQKAFYSMNNLNFDLLADTEGELANKFGVLSGSIAERTTFVIRNKRIEQIFGKVDPDSHVEELLEQLR